MTWGWPTLTSSSSSLYGLTCPDFEELQGSGEFQVSRQGNTCRRSFRVSGDNLINFVQFLASGGYPWPGSSVILPNVLVHGIKARPAEDAIPSKVSLTNPFLQMINHSAWVVDVDYETYRFNQPWPLGMNPPAVTIGTQILFQAKFSGQYLTIPSRAVRWEDMPSLPVPPDVKARLFVSLMDLNIEWDNVYYPPVDTISQLLGHVNSGTFMGLPDQTVLLEGADLGPSFWISTTLPFRYKLHYQLRVRRITFGGQTYGWNHDWRPFPAGFARVLMQDGNPRYPVSDLNTAFQQGT